MAHLGILRGMYTCRIAVEISHAATLYYVRLRPEVRQVPITFPSLRDHL